VVDEPEPRADHVDDVGFQHAIPAVFAMAAPPMVFDTESKYPPM